MRKKTPALIKAVIMLSLCLQAVFVLYFLKLSGFNDFLYLKNKIELLGVF